MPFNPNSIHNLRETTGMSQFQLAKDLDCTPQTILNWEKGRSAPNINMLDNLYGFCQQNSINPMPNFYAPPDGISGPHL